MVFLSLNGELMTVVPKS